MPRRLSGRVPERTPVVLERREPIAGDFDPMTDVGEGERGPVGEVALGRRPVTGEVPPRQLAEGLVPVQPAGRRRTLGEQGVRVLVTRGRPLQMT